MDGARQPAKTLSFSFPTPLYRQKEPIPLLVDTLSLRMPYDTCFIEGVTDNGHPYVQIRQGQNSVVVTHNGDLYLAGDTRMYTSTAMASIVTRKFGLSYT